MPIRTVKLKIFLDKNMPESTKALWTTHKLFNAYISKIINIFLLCRGENYYTETNDKNEFVKKETIRTDALNMARAIQKENIGQEYGTNEEITGLLQELYSILIPSSQTDENGIQKKGDAQTTTEFLGILMSAKTKSMQEEYPKCPEWAKNDIKKITDEKELAEITKNAAVWFKTPGIQTFIQKQKKPLWVTLKENEDPKWLLACQRYFESITEKVAAIKTIKKLKELGLLPLIKPEFSIRLNMKTLTAWEKAALRLTAAHMLSWESWNKRQQDEYEKLQEENNVLISTIKNLPEYAKLKEYEKSIHEQLKKNSKITDESPYILKKREIRLLKEFISHEPDKMTLQERQTLVDELQTKKKREFGDPEFYNWLIKDENIGIIGKEISGKNIIDLFTTGNLIKFRLDNMLPATKMCIPDAITHPQWIMYGYDGDSNLKNYKLRTCENENRRNRRLTMKIPLLIEERGELKENKYDFGIEVNKCFYRAKINDGTDVNFFNNKRQFDAKLKSLDITFSRDKLERHTFADAFINIAIDITPTVPELLEKIPLGRLSEPEKFPIGTRIMGIHPEWKNFASISIMEIEKTASESKTCFKLENGNFLVLKSIENIKLPGETPSSKNCEARHEYFAASAAMNNKISTLKQIICLKNINDYEKRESALKKLKNQINTEHLEKLINKSPNPWTDAVIDEFSYHDRAALLEFNLFKAKQSEQHRKTTIFDNGISLWNISMLEDLKNLLKSWKWHNQTVPSKNAESFCEHLTKHIKNIKETRIKTGASVIVQKAAGLDEKSKACHLIVIESPDTALSSGKSKNTNKNAMAQCWRAAITKIEMQSELYGIKTYTMYPTHCSMFSIKGIPGTTVKPLMASDLKSAEAKKMKKEYGIELKESMLVPGRSKNFVFINENQKAQSHISALLAVNIVKKLFNIENGTYKLDAERYTDPETGKSVFKIKETEKKDRTICKLKEKYLIATSEETSYIPGKKPSNINKYKAESATRLFRDPSGTYFDKNVFVPEKEYWSEIKKQIVKTINKL